MGVSQEFAREYWDSDKSGAFEESSNTSRLSLGSHEHGLANSTNMSTNMLSARRSASHLSIVAACNMTTDQSSSSSSLSSSLISLGANLTKAFETAWRRERQDNQDNDKTASLAARVSCFYTPRPRLARNWPTLSTCWHVLGRAYRVLNLPRPPKTFVATLCCREFLAA